MGRAQVAGLGAPRLRRGRIPGLRGGPPTGAMCPPANMRRGQGPSAVPPCATGYVGLLCAPWNSKVKAEGESWGSLVRAYDRVRQRIDTQMITFGGQAMHLRPVAIRYCWPAELDLMADRAGPDGRPSWPAASRALRRLDRQPFTAASDRHVSVYQRA